MRSQEFKIVAAGAHCKEGLERKMLEGIQNTPRMPRFSDFIRIHVVALPYVGTTCVFRIWCAHGELL